MEGAALQRLHDGRLHLQHGPIDVILRAWGTPDAVRAAEAAAAARFPAILPELVAELPELRRPMAEAPRAESPAARRMIAACTPFAPLFLTPMAAVAGAVADELLAAMLAATPLDRAFVNDGGDIAVHAAPHAPVSLGLVAHPDPSRGISMDGVTRATEPCGVATSGRHGRSFSLGIADAATVIARNAATADAAATLLANAVDLDSPAIRRAPAHTLDPDSDLGDRPVTTAVGPLTEDEIARALDRGASRGNDFVRRGLIRGAALRLMGRARLIGGLERLAA